MSHTPTHCADQIEALLTKRGVRLTMGGEPTFVPDMPTGAEWNNDAMGPEKLNYARRLTRKLLQNHFNGGLVMQVFGKLYPGEPLPRWVLLTLQRKSGESLWAEPSRFLLADKKGRNLPAQASRLIRAIISELGLDAQAMPAGELRAKKKTIGYVLPLNYENDAWQTGKWPYDRAHPIPLISGDSPIGLRLPLSALPEDALKRALTVEVRHGALEVFLPPLEWAGFQKMASILEALSIKLDLRDLVICGYAPYETKEETTGLGLAADPGVLEVNLPPCETWREYDTTFRAISEAAYDVGLRLTKRSLNGVIRGTGGGSHLAFGGPSVDQNVFFDQPTLLTSVLRYWQHHPALSYIFTGQYVGAGCQAPRVDEGADHLLYELESACDGLDRLPYPPTREMLDQFFRNLLTDASGNTHRAEICLDKFWNFASPSGKIGIVELRAFETLPTPEMMSTVALFIRAIITMLERTPFRKKLKRWGASLHDQYFLPAKLTEDLQAICADIKKAGIEFDPAWLTPVVDFRCPVINTLAIPGGELVVRQAFEPWPLMAEESLGASTVRVVDNSTDRIELSLCDSKLAETGKLIVNGVELPWQFVNGQAVIGLRYKCASAYPALHPHVAIQSPLHIQWQAADSVAEAKYYYWNPDGPLYDGLPDSDEEAVRRCKVRWKVSRNPLPADSQPAQTAPESQWTIDLRRQ
ncbi:transglutaminase family protein [Cerasicoccus arenae]|uniref:DUF2126 domain-containing protein n=1 Tax=Cerasicoccus arenae TaxID=424488 RepID=A0A8J3DDE4_9BACT|nr:transglutaminase family protein [Cerasicoccus arenae]MBK1859460.1 transglutaminase family protein [Cerasicoccus arenae]GHC13687.1 hypothetical protein GCM10007047_33790 [Cerasicoccus arenae]